MRAVARASWRGQQRALLTQTPYSLSLSRRQPLPPQRMDPTRAPLPPLQPLSCCSPLPPPAPSHGLTSRCAAGPQNGEGLPYTLTSMQPLTAPFLHALQTVTAAQATSMARSLPQQQIDKGAVWMAVIAGAMSLFGATLVLENRLPAIARANQAAKESKRIMEVRAWAHR